MAAKKTLMARFLRPRIIAVFAALVVGTVLIVGSQSFKAAEKAAIFEFSQRLLVTVQEATEGVDQYFETLAWALRAMANISGVHELDENITRQVLALEIQELKRLGVNDIGVLDANGILQYNAVAHELEDVDFSWRRYFQESKHKTTGNSYVIEFIEFKGVEAGKKGILIAVPMVENPMQQNHTSLPGKFKGLIICTLKLDILIEKFVSPVNAPGGRAAFLIDDKYSVLWMPDRSLIGKNLLKTASEFPSFQQVLKQMNTGVAGTGEYFFYTFDESQIKFSGEKEKKIVGYVPLQLGEERWVLGVSAPEKDAKNLIRTAYLKQLILVSIIIIATILGATYTTAMAYSYNRTLKKQVEEKTREFKESHQRLLTVFDSLDRLVYVADLETFEILFANKYMCDLFGNVTGKSCWQVLHKGLSGPCESCQHRDLSDIDDIPGGFRVREFKSTITQRWYESHDRAIRWVDGRLVRLEIAADITDRKQVEGELRRAHEEMGTFCRIIKEIGVQQSLEGVASFLMKELNTILDKHDMLLFVFNDNHEILFTLSDRETRVVKDRDLIQKTAAAMANIKGITTVSKQIFKAPLLPEYFTTHGRQTIIPFQVQSQIDGALVIVCEPKCVCEEKELELVALILEQASGTIKRAALHEEEIRALQSRIESTAEFSGIIGKDAKMQVIYKLIEDIAPTDATVLIQGESGTGKELVARAIHRRSLRKDKPFVIINCSAYPSTLLESELFGHEKGAFTGATRQKSGRFEQAHQGTVFLDEVGEIPPSAQIKLLRVLQTQKFERLGGEQTLAMDVRILAATNKSLLEEVKSGRFREDLFYRLHVIPINLPPLRTRRNDVPLLVRHFQRRFSAELGDTTIQDFSSEAMRCLLNCLWPGNVRELENSIEHAVVLSKGSRIEISHLPSGLCDAPSPSLHGSQKTILENEKKLLIEVLEECNWNKTQASLRLGISRSTLYDKIKKYQISRSSSS